MGIAKTSANALKVKKGQPSGHIGNLNTHKTPFSVGVSLHHIVVLGCLFMSGYILTIEKNSFGVLANIRNQISSEETIKGPKTECLVKINHTSP